MKNGKCSLFVPALAENKLGRKLEISRHNFKDRILGNCIYVDKTEYIYQLLSQNTNCFLSRPRRFGRSLLLSTVKEIFRGSKDLFKNCWIYDKIEWQPYPIIHLDFLGVDYRTFGLEQGLAETLDAMAKTFHVELQTKSIKGKLGELIELLAKDKKVVVLIDEFDKPIIDYMDNIPKAKKNRDILKVFYSTLKTQTQNIKFLLITGVTKFSKNSIFSELNHLKDITFDSRYSQMLGYTLEEIQHYFSDYIDQWENQTGEKREALFEKLQDFYNGYSWDGEHFVFSPGAILNFFGNYQFDNYWFPTGTPSFLVKLLKNSHEITDQYDRYEVGPSFFNEYDIDDINTMDISVLLFQTGYLTIKEVIGQKYILSYPNRDAKCAFLENLLEICRNKSQSQC